MSKCKNCVQDRRFCSNCKENPIYANVPRYSQFQEYKPVCPRGYGDCVYDPAYIKFHYPKWYKELYGDKTPEEALLVKNGCMDKYKEDPNEEYYCYDDEDK